MLPHKRENFDNANLPKIWYLIRPDKENVYQKNHRSVNGGNLKVVTNEFSKQIDLLIENFHQSNGDLDIISKEMERGKRGIKMKLIELGLIEKD